MKRANRIRVVEQNLDEHIRQENAAYRATRLKHMPKFYECGICGAWHRLEWNGDCREDAARFFPDQLDQMYGPFGWEAAEMPTW